VPAGHRQGAGGEHLPAGDDVVPALHFGRRRRRTAPLILQPALELLHRLGHHQERHVGVLMAAELGALAAIRPWRIGLNPGVGHEAWEQVAFALQARHPEAVDDITRGGPDHDRNADRNVQLVWRIDPLVRLLVVIAELPPPLMADDIDGDAAGP
jgi:hypothetical protein